MNDGFQWRKWIFRIVSYVLVAALAVLGSTGLLTPVHILLYQLVWIIPGYIVTMWTRAI